MKYRYVIFSASLVLGLLFAQTKINSSTQIKGASGTTITLTDNEVPAGVVNGTNQIFTLAAMPNPSSSLHLYLNGLRQSPGGDYVLVGTTITFNPASIPQAPAGVLDTLLADYRH